MNEISQSYLKYKICVSGAARTDCCADGAMEKTKELGREIVKQGGVIVTGATTGVPYWAAIGAKEEGGISIGFSPAVSELAHIKTYHLPIDYYDIIVYTGFDYSGRNLILTRASDAVIIVCGRLGTLNEFTIAFEDKKPIGILTGTGGTADEIKGIVDKGHRGQGKIVYDDDPKRLVAKLMEMIKEEKDVTIEFAPAKGGGE
ncbi:MAG TPA: hypothetical protein DHI91_02750 [Candidatus Portnoybacteria bacterium]|uniref:Protein containing YHS domain protein n=1 Tax=Candidatus Portnoybacteria bacterium CG02_land_8_20_14_3_00_45_8 TaxID=1974807 RepID=A0A2M7D655_9BACT|nr:MAG: hypothetical protein COS30_01765 [Candidatus Portnoybacteria bacterium CG02_land_8_20_14_3_00_45_8]HCX28033.1 hypothetical protein [Candidatus Portnoybacteria bacterium]